MQELLLDPYILILLLAVAAGVVLTVLLSRTAASDNPLRQRLTPGVQAASDTTNPASAADSIVNTAAPLPAWLGAIANMGEQMAGTAQDKQNLERLLATAGFRRPEATGLLMAAKYGYGLLFTIVMLWGVLGPQSRFGLTGLACGLLALFVGTTLPELLVKARSARRHEALSRSMPDALDLMVICAEAGLPFPRILKVVARELQLSAPPMADELAYTSAELQLLPDRTQALRHLGARTRVAAIESMVGSLIQAERYGTPLSQALRTIADETRTTLILTLEEKAGKLPAQMSVPLMTLILPPVVALVATPALMRVIRSLMQ